MANSRVVNIRYKVRGLQFDAAIDCDWQLHCYEHKKAGVTPIELYCFDMPDWDVRMMYHKERNDQQSHYCGMMLSTCANFDDILKETRKWIREMKYKPNNKRK